MSTQNNNWKAGRLTDLKVPLSILGITSNERGDAFALVLREEGGDRELPVIIGLHEAQSIAIFLQGIQMPRPLSHDLFTSLAEAFGAKVTAVVIYEIRDAIFRAHIYCARPDEQPVRVDARTSDAIAIAIRHKAKIFAFESVMRQASITVERPECAHDKYANVSTETLRVLLQNAVDQEEYERAAAINKIIQDRGNS